jgi:hypothetical protein
MRRPRGPGGRFLSASELAALREKENDTDGSTGSAADSVPGDPQPPALPLADGSNRAGTAAAANAAPGNALASSAAVATGKPASSSGGTADGVLLPTESSVSSTKENASITG